jgi:hypothetical protein
MMGVIPWDFPKTEIKSGDGLFRSERVRSSLCGDLSLITSDTDSRNKTVIIPVAWQVLYFVFTSVVVILATKK